MRILLVFLLVQILTNALRQTSCVTPMQTASIPRVLFIALVQLVLLETTSTARVRTRNDQSIRDVFSCMDILYWTVCKCTVYVLHMHIVCLLGDRSTGYAYLWANLSLGIIFFIPAPTLCQFQRTSKLAKDYLFCRLHPPPPPRRGILGLILAGYVRAGLSEPLPH